MAIGAVALINVVALSNVIFVFTTPLPQID